jgi:tRNA modification GTPase
MTRLAQLGIRQALPGEFSFRAVRNGKMSLYQAQAVADLISASNPGAVSLAPHVDRIASLGARVLINARWY